jgi:molybdopterin molybdotransferase
MMGLPLTENRPDSERDRVITPQQAWDILVREIMPLPVQELPLADALGGYLSKPVPSDRDIPPADRAIMDGYALRAEDLKSLPARLVVDGEAAAGSPSSRIVSAGHCIRIYTGAVLPDGSDTVIPVEQTSTRSFRDVSEENEIRIADPVAKGSFISYRGEHAHAGDALLPEGMRLGPRQIGIAAATGHDKVAIHRRPEIRILTTGQELLEASRSAAPHQTRDSNGPMLQAALHEAGFPHATCEIVADSLPSVTEAISRALEDSDAVIMSGGLSAGRYDYVPAALSEAGATILYRGVAMRPGRPQLFAVSASHRPVFGLPGNPLSAIAGFYELVLPALRRLSGCPASVCRPVLHLPLRSSVSNSTDLMQVIPAMLTIDPSGSGVVAHPSKNSADLITGGRVDGAILLVPRAGKLESGCTVPFRSWGGIV